MIIIYKTILLFSLLFSANAYSTTSRIIHLGKQLATQTFSKPSSIKKALAIGAVGASLYGYHIKNSSAQAEEISNHESQHLPFIRPQKVQEAADEAFESNRKTKSKWLYNGEWGWYGLLNIHEEKLIKHLVSLDKKDIYIMDIGCAKGEWAREIVNLLQTQYKKNNTKFHIFSITGSKECKEVTWTEGNITLHQLHQFKIENIDEELAKRGFDLKEKLDLIVSRWTLRHLVDPFGTLTKIYDLLNPSKGKLIANGFLFKYEDSEKVQGFPYKHQNVVTQSNASAIFYDYDAGHDTGHFLLERNDKKPLDIPLEYTGNIASISYNYQCQSQKVTEFRRKIPNNNQKPERDYVNPKERWYCLHGDEKCQQLYSFLKENDLFKATRWLA